MKYLGYALILVALAGGYIGFHPILIIGLALAAPSSRPKHAVRRCLPSCGAKPHHVYRLYIRMVFRQSRGAWNGIIHP